MSQGGDGHTLSTSYMQAPGGCVHVGLSNSHQIPTWSPPIPARPRGWSALRRGMQGSPLLGCPGLGLRGLLPTPPHPEEQNRDLNVLIKGPESCGLKHSLPDLKPGNSKAFLSLGDRPPAEEPAGEGEGEAALKQEGVPGVLMTGLGQVEGPDQLWGPHGVSSPPPLPLLLLLLPSQLKMPSSCCLMPEIPPRLHPGA